MRPWTSPVISEIRRFSFVAYLLQGTRQARKSEEVEWCQDSNHPGSYSDATTMTGNPLYHPIISSASLMPASSETAPVGRS